MTVTHRLTDSFFNFSVNPQKSPIDKFVESLYIEKTDLKDKGVHLVETNKPVTKPIKEKDVGLAIVLALFFGALGMLYVRRFLRAFIASICIVVALVVLNIIFQSKNDPPTVPLMAYLLLGGYHFVVLPVWAYKRAQTLNQEARLSRSKLEEMNG